MHGNMRGVEIAHERDGNKSNFEKVGRSFMISSFGLTGNETTVS